MNTLWHTLKQLRHKLAPEGARLDVCIRAFFEFYHFRLPRLRYNLTLSMMWWWRALLWRLGLRDRPARTRLDTIAPVAERPPVSVHTALVDVIICVHNALDDVQRCLESVIAHTTQPYRLILVDDGSNAPTRDYLAAFAAEHGATLLRSETGTGYTFAANRGLRATKADFVLLLNSDTIVTPRWLDRLMACAESDPRIGMVGPLSNTASWQSIPNVANGDDWAENLLPEGMTVAEMGDWVARISARLYPRRALLNGFCLLLRTEMLAEVGIFDESTFGAGYGEEDDLALRARAAGWELALVDDTYVYHAQSRSYSDALRRELSERAGEKLRAKHSVAIVETSVGACVDDRVTAGIRARAKYIFKRRELIQRGRARFAGRRVLFVLPVMHAGGGANVVISEAQAMQAMGVEVALFNLAAYRTGFERFYGECGLPLHYGTPEYLPAVAAGYDAVIATHNPSVVWLDGIARQGGAPVCGYYIQDFEPRFYPPESEKRRVALASYTCFPDLVRFTKTGWTAREVKSATGASCGVVGPSVDLHTFCPRPAVDPDWPTRPLRVVAMVRPDTAYRNPHLTMRVLGEISQRYGERVEIVIFGADHEDERFKELPGDFSWTLLGLLQSRQVAGLLNRADIFVDFSVWQAMGLTALEAMACGAAVVAPQRGGFVELAHPEENCLVIDTSKSEKCREALVCLLNDHALRQRIQSQALVDVCEFFPERPACNILRTLFEK